MDGETRTTETELEWTEVAHRDQVPTDGSGLVVETAAHRLAVFVVDGAAHVLDDACPHQGASLGLGVTKAGEVTCPWHGWHFALASGENTDGLGECVRVHECRMGTDGRIEARLTQAPEG